MIRKFLNYVEIRTKITSTFTFAMAIAFLMYQGQVIDWKLTLLFFVSMFLFDLTTTAINNYIDSKGNEQILPGNVQILPFERKTALVLIYILLGASILLGLTLAYFTDMVILITGGVCFLCGILYTYGPVPISRQPLGEVMSGAFYGILIPFIIFYINTPKGTYITLSLSLSTISFTLQVVPILTLLLFAVIPFCSTANIMLANNICDLEKDIAVKRHTLPYYIGKKALALFALLYYGTYAAVFIMVVFKILSPICLLSLLTLFAVQRNINKFYNKQEKSTTFILSIKNFIIIMGTNVLLILISVFV
ncbi:UbiA family prenyltransferase [Anaerocolumna sp. MB42-C2]|uniref:UbiA family prenyltransferase n=1 Tax=Anaerocolumna sp. MB42-C2 TaxID=3070997 RepID=UPI0027E15BA3|nr:UbiA family prenyltransferase [Anaerocolumna sp. MB42-C2]WMJ85722.1 UbiA family prenyltransferase [Anaerocolumna sp. MB42-C2]